MRVIFSETEKEAMVSVLCALAKADYRSRDAEHRVLQGCYEEMGFERVDFVPIPRLQLEKRAYETLKRMTKEKKRVFSRMMTKIARSDGDFGPRERAFVIEILEMCDIPFVHK